MKPAVTSYKAGELVIKISYGCRSQTLLIEIIFESGKGDTDQYTSFAPWIEYKLIYPTFLKLISNHDGNTEKSYYIANN